MLAEKFPPEFTGSGKQAFYLSQALAEKGLDVTCLCSFPSKRNVTDNSGLFSIVRLKSAEIERLRPFEFLIRSLFWLLRNRGAYDILHVHGYCWAALPAMLLAKACRKITIYKITLPGEDDPAALARSRTGSIKRLLIGRFDAFVSISNRVHTLVKKFEYLPPTVVMIPNGVDDRFSADNEASEKAKKFLIDKHGLDANVSIVSYVGSIEYRKGNDLLALAWLKVIAKEPGARLFLVGPYDRNSEFYRGLENVLDGHIGRTVFFEGATTTPELYYRASDVFVFPSRNESFGNVLVEAMACGTACVATRIEGVTDDILTNGYNGLIVEQEDHEALADAVVTILRDSELKKRLAENAVKTVNERFRMDKIAEKYIELYEDLLQSK